MWNILLINYVAFTVEISSYFVIDQGIVLWAKVNVPQMGNGNRGKEIVWNTG
jgi:hypothetical protein